MVETTYEDIFPLINLLTEESSTKELEAVLEKIPIKDKLLKEKCLKKIKEKTKLTLKVLRESYDIIHKIIKPSEKIEIGEIINEFNYDGDLIRQTEKGIFFVKKRSDYEEIFQIIEGKLEIHYYTKDISTKIPLYTFTFRNEKYNTMEVNQFLTLFRDFIVKREFGRDVIKIVFVRTLNFIDERKSESILGFNDGWKLPLLEEKNKYSIVCKTDYQNKAYTAASKMIKNYTKEIEKKLIAALSKFIKITQIKSPKKEIIIGWYLATPFRKAFIDILHSFPILYLIGERSSGKSYMNEFWGIHFFGLWDKPRSPSVLNSPARTEDYLSSSTFPLVFPEVEYIHPFNVSVIKEHCTGNSDYDRKLGVIGTVLKPKIAPISFDSNFEIYSLKDYAMNTKSIYLNFHEDERIMDDDEWTSLYDILKNKKLFSFVYKCTHEWTNANIKDLVNEIKGSLDDSIRELNKTYPRLIQIYVTIIFGIKLLKLCFGIELSTENIIDYLVQSRTNLSYELLQQFREFCANALYYKTFSTGEKPPHYINHELKNTRKGDYNFTQDNLSDFNDYMRKFGVKPYNLKNLSKLLSDALSYSDKKLISYKQTTLGKTSPFIIRINKGFIPREMYIRIKEEKDSYDILKDPEESDVEDEEIDDIFDSI